MRLLTADRLLVTLIADCAAETTIAAEIAQALVHVRKAQLAAGWERAGRAPSRLLEAERRFGTIRPARTLPRDGNPRPEESTHTAHTKESATWRR